MGLKKRVLVIVLVCCARQLGAIDEQITKSDVVRWLSVAVVFTITVLADTSGVSKDQCPAPPKQSPKTQGK